MLPTFNIPPIGPKQGKVWGSTSLIFANDLVECHLIEIKKGGFCSIHNHKYKWNRFVLVSGKLEISIFHKNGSIDRTVLEHSQITDVPPGVGHQFEALEDSEAIEIYWVSLDAQDIDRMGTKGGIRS